MSRENVELTMRANAAFNRGDVEEALRFYAPDAKLRDLQSAPDQPLDVSGVEAIREVWVNWTSAFDALRADVEEYIDAGDTVIVAVRWWGKGTGSDLVIDNRQFDAFDFEGGKVVGAVLGYRSRDEALEAAKRWK